MAVHAKHVHILVETLQRNQTRRGVTTSRASAGDRARSITLHATGTHSYLRFASLFRFLVSLRCFFYPLFLSHSPKNQNVSNVGTPGVSKSLRNSGDLTFSSPGACPCHLNIFARLCTRNDRHDSTAPTAFLCIHGQGNRLETGPRKKVPESNDALKLP